MEVKVLTEVQKKSGSIVYLTEEENIDKRQSLHLAVDKDDCLISVWREDQDIAGN